jgi:hypothetical protein
MIDYLNGSFTQTVTVDKYFLVLTIGYQAKLVIYHVQTSLSNGWIGVYFNVGAPRQDLCRCKEFLREEGSQDNCLN